jgi:hypothetical protein
VDPLSALIALIVVCHMVSIVAEDLARGETGPSHQARLRQLAEAGYQPTTTGSPLHRFLANAWRAAWVDAQTRHAARRAARAAQHAANAEQSAWARWRHAMGERIAATSSRVSDRWKTPTAAPQDPDQSTHAHPPDEAGIGADAPDPEQPQGSTSATAGPDPSTASEGAPREPIRAQATVGTPTHDHNPQPQPQALNGGGAAGAAESASTPTQPAAPAALPAPRPPQSAQSGEGEPAMSNAVAANGVTGVLSGAAAARAIARQVELATEMYVGTLNHVRVNVAVLGDQTVSVVQMSGQSRVVALLLQAAEAAAAAQAAARQLGAEVSPLLDAVARAYDRLNS